MAISERFQDLFADVEKLIGSDDPYERQHGHSNAVAAYHQLAEVAQDQTWRLAALYAAQHHMYLAARVRHENRIPVMLPKTEAAWLHGGMCAGCGREWRVVADPDDSCPQCPTLLFGSSPRSRDEAEHMPAGQVVPRGDVLRLWHGSTPVEVADHD